MARIGDLYVTVAVEIPRDLTKEERAVFERAAELKSECGKASDDCLWRLGDIACLAPFERRAPRESSSPHPGCQSQHAAA